MIWKNRKVTNVVFLLINIAFSKKIYSLFVKIQGSLNVH
nr:MAG TPA: hypothetical protein [Caudoviricetes sp.]